MIANQTGRTHFATALGIDYELDSDASRLIVLTSPVPESIVQLIVARDWAVGPVCTQSVEVLEVVRFEVGAPGVFRIRDGQTVTKQVTSEIISIRSVG